MVPVIALVGRPNVGKSTLFNRLTKTRDAIVADFAGLTRDRKYGEAKWQGRTYIVVDTGGISGDEEGIDLKMAEQSLQAIEESDAVLFLVDSRDGMTVADQMIAEHLRKRNKRTFLVANKVDTVDPEIARAEFSPLAIGDAFPIAAAHGRGVNNLLEAALGVFPKDEVEVEELSEEQVRAAAEEGGDVFRRVQGIDETTGIKIAVIGRPNVGKSTLVNRLLGEDRVVVSDVAGTTRDSIRVPLERDGKRYTLIDTAGVRRRARIEDAVEKFSVIKTLQSIEAASVVVLLLDAKEGVTDQDAGLIGHVLEAQRALVIAVNKWDGLSAYDREQCRVSLARKLVFVDWAPQVTISALHGSGIGELIKAVNRSHASAGRTFTSSELTRALEAAYEGYQPPLVRGHAPKLKYAHPGGTHPPTIVIHGSRTRHLADSYRRYLENFFRTRYRLVGTPIRIDFRDGDNPYAGKRNELTEGQQRRRQRMIRNAKRGKR